MDRHDTSSPAAGQYDEEIRAHYDQVARTHRDSPASTMEDPIVRAKETEFIHAVVAEVTRRASRSGTTRSRALSVIDVGCGNGYTLATLVDGVADNAYSGVEFNDSQRAVAVSRLSPLGIDVAAGDVRKRDSLPAGPFDILLCQRVLINLLDDGDQQRALENLISMVAPGGVMIFIEAFQHSLDNLNAARGEFGIEPISPATHNLYLREGFFEHPALEPWSSDAVPVNPDMLSTHYYVTRVFHEVILRATSTDFKRNSHFVRLWSRALPDGVGSYAPLRLGVFTKKKTGR